MMLGCWVGSMASPHLLLFCLWNAEECGWSPVQTSSLLILPLNTPAWFYPIPWV